MQWLNIIVDKLIKLHPEGEIIVSSGVSPSGAYHLGTFREVLTAEAIAIEIRKRNRSARHLHIVDDLDVFRKVPVNLPESYAEYIGVPLCDIPAPDGSDQSYADFFLQDLLLALKRMKLSVEIVRAHEKYRGGFYAPAIELALGSVNEIREILEYVSGRTLDEHWFPVQVLEEGHLKNREFKGIDKQNKTIEYLDKNNNLATANYARGEVKLNWRIDWPSRWWLLNVHAEPFGRDHATKGGSYDTGKEIASKVFNIEAPIPIPYAFINRAGETKKMSKSAGNVVTVTDLLEIMPCEIIWFFILRYSPDKQLFFGEGETLLHLFDEFAELLAKSEKTDQERQLLSICLGSVDKPTVSQVPFSHLVASYQAALKDPDKTLQIIGRTEYANVVNTEAETITTELRFIDKWLEKWAPSDVKFALLQNVNEAEYSEVDKKFFNELAGKIANAPDNADGAWFHKTIYELKDSLGLEPQQMFSALYKLIIGQSSGPRAGWFLSILPREWLINRLNMQS